MWLAVLGTYGSEGAMDIFVEQPADPAWWVPWWRPKPPMGYASYLTWPETWMAMEICSLREIHLDQGAFGHEHTKPTALLTTCEEVKRLNETRVAQGMTKGWPAYLDDRLMEARQASEWAPGLCEVLAEVIQRRVRQQRWRTPPGAQRGGALPEREEPTAARAAALRSSELQEASMWAAHYHAGHVPFRRDCAICLEAAGRDRPRKAVPHPSAYTWSLDLMGPFVESKDQELLKARYGLVTVVTIPVQDELPVVRGLQELGAGKPKLRQPHLPTWGEEEPPQDQEGEWEAGEQEPQEELTSAEVTKIQVLEKQWKDFLKEAKDVGEMKTLTFVQPVKSRASKDILQAVMRVYSRIQALQIPVLRVHMDREKALMSKELTMWMQQKGLYCAYTAGDEPCGNARAEREIGVLRGRCRSLMRSTQLDPGLWALAFRHAGEERLRAQLWQCGVATPTLLPFASQAMVKKKRWFNRADPWRWPMTPVTILGPAGDMSLSSGGYFCRDEEGRFFRSTVVVIPKQQATTALALEKEMQRLQQAGQGGSVEDANPEMNEAVVEAVDGQPGGAPPQLFGAEDIFEAYRLHGELPQSMRESRRRLHPTTVVQQVSQSVHEDQQISQSVHEHQQVSQSAHEAQQVSQSMHEQGQHPQLENGQQPISWAGVEQSAEEVILEERAEQDVLVVMDPPTRRVTGKSTPGQLLPHGPSLRPLRKGGECEVEDDAEAEACRDKFELWQHRRMKNMVQEEMANILEGNSTDDMIKDWLMETQAMEKIMEVKAKIRALAIPEVLQTRTVPLEEVRQNLEDWRPAFEKEYNTLTAGPVEVLSKEKSEELRRSGVEIEVLPMKAVTVMKPDKYKARFVVCGNLAAETADEEDTSVGGICTIAVRSLVHRVVLAGWKLGTIDVAAAFLQAPRRGDKIALVEPPAILRQLGLCRQGEQWRVRCALYGFAESPADWGAFRDKSLRSMSWEVEDEVFTVMPTEEPHLWQILQTSKKENMDQPRVRGYMAVYVDDLLVGGDRMVLDSFFSKLKSMWRCSPEEMVEENKWTRFCGYELREDGDGGMLLSQANYVRDVVTIGVELKEEKQLRWERFKKVRMKKCATAA